MLRKLWIPTSSSQLLQAQEKLLAYHQLTPLYKRNRIELPSTLSESICGQKKSLIINFIEFSSSSPSSLSSLSTCVLAHGLGSGLALFYSNLRYLSQKFDRVLCVDWLGFGGSDRPSWKARPDTITTTESADFFIHSLKEFVEQTNCSPFTFIGHSLGGLLATEYAMRYPKDIHSLYLISPAGLPAPPLDATLISNQVEVPTSVKVLDAAWQNNVTPGAMVRMMGPKGKEKHVLG